MTERMNPSDDDDILAGEYVVGVLTLEQRVAVEARRKTDSRFAQRITDWETDLGGLNDGYADARAPNLMPKIEQRLFAEPVRQSGFSFGKFLLGAATAMVFSLALFLTLPDQRVSEQVAMLQSEAGDLEFAANYDGQTLTLTQIRGALPPAGQVYELWLIAANSPPESLGVLDGNMARSTLPDLATGVTLAVSLEPAGGSTTGVPTGPVLTTGIVQL